MKELFSDLLCDLEDRVDQLAELTHTWDLENPEYVRRKLYEIKRLIHKLAIQVEASEEA